jgi:hypothetical protein
MLLQLSVCFNWERVLITFKDKVGHFKDFVLTLEPSLIGE